MKKFISCDWGTSSLRLKVVDEPSLEIPAGISTDEGIANTYELWKQSGANDEKKLFFYQSVISNKIKELEKQLNISLTGIPVIISGMASSSIGMMELPYHNLPFSIGGSDLLLKKIPANTDFNHDTIIVSGVKSQLDVVRGEETQLVGCEINPDEDRIFIFPGTHSKHIVVRRGKAVNCKTFMTGEFLYLLSSKSILSSSVEEHDQFFLEAFEAGVMESLQSNLLHESFRVRINELFGTFSRKENYNYLKGLLIGTELRELFGEKRPLTVVGSEPVTRYYEAAMRILNMDKVKVQDSEQATIKGHYKIITLITKRSFNLNKTIL